MAKVKKQATTQKFTQIQQIEDSIVIFHGARAASVIEVTATNFALESEAEQQVQISEYASFLNSLSFPIQIIIKSRKLDITSYLKSLDIASQKAHNQLLSSHILSYKEFVANLVKKNTVLDKKFYIVVPFSSLEEITKTATNQKNQSEVFFEAAKRGLFSKTNTITASLKRVNLRYKILEKQELIKLYYEFYNNQEEGDANFSQYIENTLTRGKI